MSVFIWYKPTNRFSKEVGGVCSSYEQALENLTRFLKLREQEYSIDFETNKENNIEEFVLDE